MKHTDEFYNRAAEYQRKRADIVSEYETRLEKLETAKGSQYYIDEKETAEAKRDKELAALKKEYGNYFNAVLKAMQESNTGRTMTAPSDEELRLITALKMRESLTEQELVLAANKLKDNPACLSILQEIAHKQGILRNFTSAREMSIADTEKAIKALAAATSDFMAYDTSRAARLAAEYQSRKYGTTGREPQKRELFTDKESCFRELAPGLAGDTFSIFCAAVDG